MDVTIIIYVVLAIFAAFMAVAAVVVWRTRKEPGTGPRSDRPHDFGSDRMDNF
ncbi:MAG: hypothetical protein H6873_12675 [Hyphomicrobiaceae bacterium]|nr:hypothetical protein [Hyphomicrobiaceae bacterium]